MSESYAHLNLYQKLAFVQRAVDIIQKDASGFGYKYVSEEELLPRINAELDKYGVTLYPSIVPQTLVVTPYKYEKKNKKTGDIENINEFYAQADMCYFWVNNDNPDDKIVVSWAMVGDQADSSQAFGSGLTYAERYFLLKYFHCATTQDDPDKIRSEHAEKRAVSDTMDIIRQIDEIVQAVVAEHPEEKGNIEKMVTKYVDKRTPDGKLVPTRNYREIKKKAKAMALLAELTKTYRKD